MHRQIAGKLTGPVTKWIVLVFWLVVVGGLGAFAAEAHRRPEQRGVVLAPRERRVHQGAREARALPGPQRHPDRRRLRAHQRPHARTTSAAATAQVEELRRARRRRGRGHRPASRPRTARSMQTSVTFNFGNERLERHARHRRRACARSPTIDGVNVYVAGAGGQAADSAEAFERHRRHPALRRARRGHRDPAVHLPQPGPVDPADHLGGRRAVHRAGASSTSWPSTPT